MIMKKLNKLFAILIAVLGVQTLSAQTDVTSTYLTNADFSSTDGWTQYISGSYRDIGSGNIGGKLASYAASSTDATHLNSEYFFGFQCRWSGNYSSYNQETSQLLPAGVYTLSYDVQNVNGSTTAATYNNLFYVKVGEKTLSDASTEWMKGKSSWTSHSITFLITDPTKVTVSLGYGTGSNNFHTNNTPVLYVSHLKLTYRGVDDINAENPADFTSLIKNPSFETGNLDGWTYKSSSDTGVKPNSDNTYKTSGVDGNYLYNTWWQGTPLTQTVGNIPNGIYELKVLLASDQNAKLFLLANDEHSEVYTITTDNKTFHDVSYEFKVLNGQAKIGVVGGNDAGEYLVNGHWWYKADNFRLIYKGADLSIEREALDAALAKARAIDQATIPTVVAVSLNSAISTAENVENALNPIKAATNALLAVLATVDVVQAPYIETKALITSSNNMLTNSTASDADKATFQGVINKAEENLNDATDKATIDAIAVTIMDAQKAYCLVASPTEGHPFDMTHLIVNPKFDQDKTGWNSDGGAQNKAIASNKPEPITGKFYENWNPSNFTGSIYQEISGLPNGTYKLKAAAFGNNAVLFANDAATQMADNDNTPAWYEVEVKVNDGTLKFGVQNNNNTGWMGIDNVTLKFVSGLDLSEFVTAYETALAAALAARDNVEYESVTGLERTNLVQAIDATPEETKEWYQSATTALSASTSAFTAAKGAYDTLNAEKTIAAGLGMSEGSIASAAATTKTGLVALQDLKVAEYNYIQDTYTENVTLGSWTEDFASDLDGEGYKVGGPKYLDDWQGNKTTRTTKQTVTLPAGDYALSVIARGQAAASGNLYYKIGDVTTDIALIMKGNRGRGVDVYGVANFSEEGEYNCNGEGFGWEYRFITFRLDTETQVEIGASITIQGQWASTYAPVLYTTEESQKVLLLDEINTLLSNVPSGKMGAAVAAALESAVSVAEGVSNATELSMLSEVASDLRSAVADAKASISGYAKLEGYISMTKVFTDVTQYEQKYENGEFATDDVETVRQELNVLRFNAASEIFPNKIEVTGWEGSMGGKNTSGQHWDGTDTKYYDNNSWNGNAHSTMTSIELPKGTYVLKAALRSSANTTLTLTVLDQIVNVEGKGDTGYGVDTKGDANFSSDGSYANNNAGRGWEWEFVKFELEETTTVTLKVECNYNGVYGWASFSDITLWMDDETYITVNGGAINAPLAAAKALVDTKPMGVVEKTALQNAIAQAEGTISTPAELDGAIAALETAVANANAWVVAYNEAKAPLVAALERFEADYNKDGVKMSQTVWDNVLEKVKAAAVAKDVTDSYDGFAVAAEELNAALDAAQASIDAYAALNEVIENANTTANGGNIGDQPFQRPVSAQHTLNAAITVAQDAYDAAESDATEVKNTLATAVEAFNNAELNAPAEGYVFKVAIRPDQSWQLTDKPLTFADNGTGGVSIFKNRDANYYAQTMMLKQVEGNKYTMSTIAANGTELYVSTGKTSGHGSSNVQIRLTDDVDKALHIEIIPTATEGLYNLKNTEADALLGCQDDKEQGGLYTCNVRNNFTITKVDMPSVTIKTSNYWATMILPFAAEIPEGLTVYSCDEVDGKVLTLDKVEKIEANTPYLICGATTEFNHTFTGFGAATATSYTKGLFTGTYVEYLTTANSNTYVLQKQNGKVAFYLVGESAQPKVAPYRCYLTVPTTSEAKAFFFDNEATGINGVDAAGAEIEAIYTINGTRVNNLQKGLNIVKMSNGKTQKVYVK